MVHRAALVLQSGDGCRPLVGHHYRVPAGEHGSQHRDRGQDPGHRHVPVEEAELGRAEQLRIDLPLGAHHGQPGDRGRLLDGREPVGGPAHDEQCGVADPAHVLRHHDRVDPAAERHQRAAADRGLFRLFLPGGSWIGTVGLDAQGREVQGVAVGELAQALKVELAEEAQLGLGQRDLAQVNDRRCRSLVVGHTRQQEHQARGGPGRAGSPPRPGRQCDPFRELLAVQRITAGQRSGLRVGRPGLVAEYPPAWRQPAGKSHLGQIPQPSGQSSMSAHDRGHGHD